MKAKSAQAVKLPRVHLEDFRIICIRDHLEVCSETVNVLTALCIYKALIQFLRVCTAGNEKSEITQTRQPYGPTTKRPCKPNGMFLLKY